MSIVYLGKATPASGQGGGGSITVDQTYDATSTNAQSGTAVAEAVVTKQNVLTAGSNISINNNIISATDTTYSAFVGATSRENGTTGLVPAPLSADRTKYLKGDGTWATVSGLQNIATGSNSLTILGTETISAEAINIGKNTTANGHSVAVGVRAISALNSVAIGNGAKNASGTDKSVAIGGGWDELDDIYALTETTGSNAIAIGFNTKASQSSTVIGTYATTGSYTNCIVLGTLATASDNNSLWVGSYRNPNTYQTVSYKLMDLSTGKIPNDRINGVSGSFTSQDGKTITVTNGIITNIATIATDVNLTFNVTDEMEVESLIVNGTTYTSKDFNNDALTLQFQSGTSITWSITLNSLTPSPSQGSLTITSDTTVQIDFYK